MIDAAEEAGLLKPGGTIVEPTSGNTGAGLAIVAAQRGYHCIFVMSDKMSNEKVALLRSYGAEVVVCPTAVPPEDPRSYYSTAERLVRETPGSFRPDQYSNPANPLAHERTTGPEIWEQTAGRVTHFVAGIGTGGTITGVARALEGAEPERADRRRGPVGLGVLRRHRPAVPRRRRRRGLLADHVRSASSSTASIEVSDADSFLTARRVTREEGLAHRRLVRHRGARRARSRRATLGPDDVVVVLLPDSGPQLPLEDLRRPVDVRHGLPARRRPRRRRRARGARAASSPTSC